MHGVLPSPSSSALRFWAKGFKDAASLPAPLLAMGLIGIGPLALAVGHPLGAAIASTLFVWAGPAQVLFYGGLAAGLSPLGIATAVTLSSVRFLPMTMSLLPLVRRPGQSLLQQLLMSHFVTVTVWSESLRRLPHMPQEERVPYYFGFAMACCSISTLATGVGYLLSGQAPLPIAAGLLFLTPMFFTVSISAGARGLSDGVAIASGFLLQPIALALIGPELDLLLVGLVGGTAAFVLDRSRTRAA